MNALSRKMDHKTLDTLFKSKQFKEIEKVLSKEQAESLKERLQKRVNRAPDRFMSVGDTFAAMRTIKGMAKKDNLPVADIDALIVEGFEKANKDFESWGMIAVGNKDH
jgi:hypothetical protein